MDNDQKNGVDDPSLPDSEKLWRNMNIPKIPSLITVDKNTGKKRPSSSVFIDKDNSEELSIDIASMTTLEKSLSLKPPGSINAEIIAAEPRRLGFGVRHTPTPQNPAHGDICGKMTKSKARRLAGTAILRELEA